MFYKVLIIFLLNLDILFNIFGYEVEKIYVDIVIDGDDEGWLCIEYFFFYCFKMMLKIILMKVCVICVFNENVW